MNDDASCSRHTMSGTGMTSHSNRTHVGHMPQHGRASSSYGYQLFTFIIDNHIYNQTSINRGPLISVAINTTWENVTIRLQSCCHNGMMRRVGDWLLVMASLYTSERPTLLCQKQLRLSHVNIKHGCRAWVHTGNVKQTVVGWVT